MTLEIIKKGKIPLLKSKLLKNSNFLQKKKFQQTRKIYVVIGTRAQLIKMAPLMSLMQKEGLEYEFIYTAQVFNDLQKKIPGTKGPILQTRNCIVSQRIFYLDVDDSRFSF